MAGTKAILGPNPQSALVAVTECLPPLLSHVEVFHCSAMGNTMQGSISVLGRRDMGPGGTLQRHVGMGQHLFLLVEAATCISCLQKEPPFLLR